MIDAGCGIEPERIAGNIERLGIPKDRVDLLILTHAHGDHAAGARYFRDYYGLQVAVSDEAAPWLEQGDRNKTSVDLVPAEEYWRTAGFVPCTRSEADEHGTDSSAKNVIVDSASAASLSRYQILPSPR